MGSEMCIRDSNSWCSCAQRSPSPPLPRCVCGCRRVPRRRRRPSRRRHRRPRSRLWISLRPCPRLHPRCACSRARSSMQARVVHVLTVCVHLCVCEGRRTYTPGRPQEERRAARDGLQDVQVAGHERAAARGRRAVPHLPRRQVKYTCNLCDKATPAAPPPTRSLGEGCSGLEVHVHGLGHIQVRAAAQPAPMGPLASANWRVHACS